MPGLPSDRTLEQPGLPHQSHASAASPDFKVLTTAPRVDSAPIAVRPSVKIQLHGSRSEVGASPAPSDNTGTGTAELSPSPRLPPSLSSKLQQASSVSSLAQKSMAEADGRMHAAASEITPVNNKAAAVVAASGSINGSVNGKAPHVHSSSLNGAAGATAAPVTTPPAAATSVAKLQPSAEPLASSLLEAEPSTQPAGPPAAPSASPAATQQASSGEAVKAAIAEVSAAARSGMDAAKALVAATRNKQRPYGLTLTGLLTFLFFCWLAGQVVLVRLVSPPFLPLACSMVVGVGVGLALSFLYYSNIKEKQELNQVLGFNLGLKGLQYLVGELPSWLSYAETEKIEWLNAVLVELWPFVDRAVCKMVKNQVERICADTIRTQKVPIKSVGFKQLTFGDAPFRVEHISVNESNEHGMEMELGIRWCGDANITLAIELSGEMTKMCPRVTDITFVATAKVRLAPLCNIIPGFGGIMFCFTKPPRIGYNLNVGKALGGSVISGVIKPFIQDVVHNQIVNLMVWPQRMVIPMAMPGLMEDEEVQRGVKAMALRNRGLMKVEVLQGQSLHAADAAIVLGKDSSDPYVKLSTDGKYQAKTKTLKRTLDPEWNQTFYLLVQEPTNQNMQVTVWDQDLTGDEIIGRCLVKLGPACKQEKTPHDNWYHLGPGDWADPAGCGKGNGKIQLVMTYRSTESFLANEPKDATHGILVVTIHKVEKMRFGMRPVTLLCEVECNNQKWESGAVTSKDGKDHLFNFKNAYEFYDVRFDRDVKVTVLEQVLASNDEVGSYELAITDIAEAQDRDPVSGLTIPGYFHRRVKLDDAEGWMELSLRFMPYF